MGKLRFGGPRLPDNAVTWYDHINPDGSFVPLVRIRPGDVIDEERFEDPQSYVDRGMATRVPDDAPTDETRSAPPVADDAAAAAQGE